jgi:hypothetical protein
MVSRLLAFVMERTRGQESEPRADRLDHEVQQYLDRMGKAITAGDGETIAGMWDLPALVIGDTMLQAVSTREELASFFGGAREQYNSRGITDTRAEIVTLEWATDRIAIVTVRWPYLDESGREMGEESSTYTLRRNDAGELKMVSALMRGASQPH